MPTLGEVRQKFPQYDDLSDSVLADGLYNKFYSDMPRETFDQKIGFVRPPNTPQSFDPFAISQGPNARPDLSTPPQSESSVTVSPDVGDRLERKGLAPASPPVASFPEAPALQPLPVPGAEAGFVPPQAYEPLYQDPNAPPDTGPPIGAVQPYFEAAQHGGAQALRSLQQTGQAVTGATPAEAPPEYPEAQPFQWGDLTDPALAARKLIYGAAASSPTLGGAVAGGVGGGMAGGAVGGPVGAAVGGIGGSALGAAAGQVAQSIGPYYADALKQGVDPDTAFDQAVKSAATDGAISAVAFGAFGWAPFSGAVKNILFQALGPQPTIAAAGRAAKNVLEGRPIEEGVSEEIPGAVLGTIAPAAVMHGVHRAVRGEPTPAGAPGVGPDVEDFLRRADEAQVRRQAAASRAEIDEFLRKRAEREAAQGQGAPALPPPTREPSSGAAPEAREPSSGTAPEAPATDRDGVLRAFGFTDDQIAGMGEAEKQGWADEAARVGIGQGKPPAPPAPEAVRPEQPSAPLSILQFIASKGGIADDGTLKAQGFNSKTRVVVPGTGFRSVLRPNGLSLEQMRQEAAAAGYQGDLIDQMVAERGGPRPAAPAESGAPAAPPAPTPEQQQEAATIREALAADPSILDHVPQEAIDNALVNEAAAPSGGHEGGEARPPETGVGVPQPSETSAPEPAEGGRPEQGVPGRPLPQAPEGGANQPHEHGEAGGVAQPVPQEPGPAEVLKPAKRAFPAYTTQQLRDTLADSARVRGMRPETVEKMRAELAARETGLSKPAITPQIVPERPTMPPAKETPAASPQAALANTLAEHLSTGKPLTSAMLHKSAEAAYGSKLSEGKWDRKDAYDALELAVNKVIQRDGRYRADTFSWQKPAENLESLVQRLPKQTVRSEEQERFQQFSTPPHYAMAVAYAANLRNGDRVLEPSAGTGSLVAAASRPGVSIVANELAPARAALLRDLVGKNGQVFTENAEQIGNILPKKGVEPTVVVMNPPFSQTAGRMGDKKDLMVAANHINEALKTLAPGGRLVAIVGRGMSMDAPRYRNWWKGISDKYAVRANIAVSGEVYAKYGTTFGTRLLVIDKVPPEGKPILAEAKTIPELMGALEAVRNVRPAELGATGEQVAAQPSGAELAPASEGEAAPAGAARPESHGVGPGQPGGGRVAAERPSASGAPSGRPPGVEAGERHGVPAEQPERPGRPAGAGERPVPAVTAGAEPGTGGVRTPGEPLQPNAGATPGAPAGGERGVTDTPAQAAEKVELENATPGTQAGSEINDNLYQPYTPQRVRIKGSRPHPGPLVESAAMASVQPPKATYNLALPRKVVDGGLLSLPQLESVVYAGQAHSKMLEHGEGQTPRRRGFFIGDGTGVGKGREIAGVILDNWERGNHKAVWVSEKRKLLVDAQRDWSGLGQDKNLIFNLGKVKPGEPIGASKGIGFITYDTLKGGMSDQAALARGGFARGEMVKWKDDTGAERNGKIAGKPVKTRGRGLVYAVRLEDGTTSHVEQTMLERVGETVTLQSRIDQIAKWVGEDFDGVIAFDEAHNMANAVQTKEQGRVKDAAQKALAGLQLQERLPNARVVYVSATGATEVQNLAYAERLGLWGRGTPFTSRAEFINKVEQGGIAAMELVARDMKQLGVYIARNLSYDGVEYNRLEHKLTAPQREIYDTAAHAWQVVLRNIEKALETTGGDKDWRARAAAKSAFWGAHQRFFNQIITSLQMPSVLKTVEADLKAGHQVVLQLTNTNEAAQERAAAKAETAEDIEDLDITPRDQLIQLVEKSFPTQQYETFEDPETGRQSSRPVVDSEGNPVENKEAVAMRDALIEQVASMRVPQGPLDLVLDHFGTDTVAEVTGRKRRFVLKPDEKTGEKKRVEESRPGSANQSEIDAFQGGKKKVLVFSEAGGTGASYHADNTAASKNARRVHYLVQAGWRADKAVQGFGRTHRTNQASAPIFRLVTTDLDGQKRFISSIARRLGQLGALTKGQRQAGDQGVFTQRDNLESTEAREALRKFWTALQHGEVEGIEASDFAQQTGLALKNIDKDGRMMGYSDPPDITQFLNRLLSLKIDMQNRVFQRFSEVLDAVIEVKQQAGLLDAGMETVKADKITKKDERVVHTDENSGAETRYVKLTLANRFVPTDFEATARNPNRPIKFWLKSPHGKVYGAAEAPTLTSEDGYLTPQYRLISPTHASRLIPQENVSGEKWSKIDKPKAKEMWGAEIEAAPEFLEHDLHLITGAILPIWDRVKGHPRVVRLATDEGEHFLGRVVPQSGIAETLKALGAEAGGIKVTPEKLHAQLLAGSRAKLANGWTLKRSLVAGEQRIELVGPASFSEGLQVKNDGAFTEKIAYNVRYFIPTGPEGAKVLERITEHRPVVELGRAGEMVEQIGPQRLGIEKGPNPADWQQRQELAQTIANIIHRYTGNTNVEIYERIGAPPSSEGWGKFAERAQEMTVQGRYRPVDRLIQLSMSAVDPFGTISHESFHDIEAWLQTPREREALVAATPRLREYVLANDRTKGYTRDELESMAGYEVRAEAFRIFASQRARGEIPRGVHITATRFFERLWQILRSIYETIRTPKWQKIFEQYTRGEAAKREPRLRTDFTLFEELGPEKSIPGAPPEPPDGKPTPSKLRAAASRLLDISNDLQMAVAPMAAGRGNAAELFRASAKDFANTMRYERHLWAQRDKVIEKNFSPERRRAMWEAADAETVALQQGKPSTGYAGLDDRERSIVEQGAKDAAAAWETARDVGVISEDAEGLPAYAAPRMVVRIGSDGRYERGRLGEYAGNIEGIGRGFHTSTGQTRQRKYLTAEETEQAMKAHFGEGAHIARDIRALFLATARLREAIAARQLINDIEQIGRLSGESTVSEGEKPEEGHWFTLDHPSFYKYRPTLKRNPQTGKWEIGKYEDGRLSFERVPIYIRGEFKGPLMAVLQKEGPALYRDLMALKGKVMSVVMYSPVIHNVVEWSRSLPAAPLKVLSTAIYWEGNRAKNDPRQMGEAIRAGMVPIGARFFNQDITSIMEQPNLQPGRSTTARVLGYIPGLFDEKAGNAVLRAIDAAGDVWHNKLLWDRIGDLQMGLYVNFLRDLIRKGFDAKTAARMAGHFANRYAGALPIESMSAGARMISNILLFSRTFTFGNLGVLKDAIRGLPRDVQAQILRDAGRDTLRKAQGYTRRKAISVILLEAAIGIISASILNDALKLMRGDETLDELAHDYIDRALETGDRIAGNPIGLVNWINVLWSLSSTASNEPGKDIAEKARILLYYDSKGRAIYGKNPVGRMGEEFTGWVTSPGDMVLKKLSTFVKPIVNVLANDRYFGAGFDRPGHIWRPDPQGMEIIKNVGRIAEHFIESQLPGEALRSAWDLAVEHKKEPSTMIMKMVGPLVGMSVSQGHPRGAMGAIKAKKQRERELDKEFSR